ncbi:hypothetical protein LDENG_00274840 [Lucifuga dentata]|nr:hypothetical protein LDENG_00274840 [Lucifuga dentata]
MAESFFTGLPQISAAEKAKLEAPLSMEELYAALMGLENGRSPGLDGLPVDFYESFWPVEVHKDLHRPDVLEVSGSLAVDTGLISIDQEKAFDQVEHQYLWQTLAAFGFSPGFIAKIQVLYIASVLKITGEGGQGLIHLASRGTAFHVQFVQRLRTGPSDLVWRPLAFLILQRCCGFGLSLSLFLMDFKKQIFSSLPGFYCSVFSAWTLLRKQRLDQTDSLYWLLREPVMFGGRLNVPDRMGASLSKMFCAAGILNLGHVVDLTGPALDNPATLAAHLGVRSLRLIELILKDWKHQLTGHECGMLKDFHNGLLQPEDKDPFPGLRLNVDVRM